MGGKLHPLLIQMNGADKGPLNILLETYDPCTKGIKSNNKHVHAHAKESNPES